MALELHGRYGLEFKSLVPATFDVLELFILFAFSCLFDLALDFGKYQI